MPRRSPGLRVVAREGSASLYLRGTVRGSRVFESAGTGDPRLAEEARAAREAELYRGAVHGTKPRVTFAAAAASYLEAEPRPPSTKAFLGRLLRFLGASTTCEEVDQDRLDRAARVLCRSGAKPATRLRNVVTPARAVLMHAARRGWCPVPLFERVRAGPARTDWLTPAEAERQIDAAGPLFRPLLTVLYCTGARLSEALGLDWSDVDLQHARMVLRQTKNGRDRIVELPPRALVEMANLPGRTGRVFRHRDGTAYRVNNGELAAYGGQVRKVWGSALAGAGIERRLTPHHARHTWASWHYAVHRDLLRLRHDGNWTTVSQVERYAHLVPTGMAAEIEAFWAGAKMVHQRAEPFDNSRKSA